ncbi:PKD domain containing protein [Methanosalsum zhilinae DSM 4017]|uniref:PKD domain containing protein n=1 Tax=Methanosalsum zhilinae (strain DSM 4017 / NBRC 107636 / OCM 62 / WeN5) TaxID=679901 RepID=F7XLC5_METZD|nr:PKD domain-containing protein [Methanosalsum zhilinae]AEH60783.1 PKD domain containing protein [Methanosalsum zhilinae DSM 4017]
MIKGNILRILVILIALSLFGMHSVASQDSEPREFEVLIQGFDYDPSEIIAHVNDTVVWTNMDTVRHTVTADEFDSGDLDQGDSFNYTFTEPGTYDYVCIYHPGMRGTVIVEAEVDYDVPPVADFTANPTSGIAPLEVSFTDNSDNAVEYHWDFGDGQTSTEVNPTHTYELPGAYTVTLTVSNEVGEDSTEEFITVGHPDDDPAPAPGFGLIFAIAGLLVIASLVKRINEK